MPTRAKICGLRTAHDLQCAIDAGAHAVGFIVGARHFTEDELSVDAARSLIAQVPVFVQRVLVTHAGTAAAVVELVERLPVHAVQLHDEISADDVRAIRTARPNLSLIRAVHVTGEDAVAEARRLGGLADALVLDTKTGDRIGGTGKVHDWSISRKIVSEVPVPVILAGGLNPDNVAEAIEQVKPYAVDVNSGVEDASGAKDPAKVKTFVATAWACSG